MYFPIHSINDIPQINYFSKDIFHNPSYNILSRERYTGFVFFKLTSCCFAFPEKSSQISRFKASRAVFIVIFLSSISLRLIYSKPCYLTKRALALISWSIFPLATKSQSRGTEHRAPTWFLRGVKSYRRPNLIEHKESRKESIKVAS